jgi:hypothetical protein
LPALPLRRFERAEPLAQLLELGSFVVVRGLEACEQTAVATLDECGCNIR